MALCSELCSALSIHPSNIRGYREFSYTDCPGDWLFGQLSRLRQEVAANMGTPLTPGERLAPKRKNLRKWVTMVPMYWKYNAC